MRKSEPELELALKLRNGRELGPKKEPELERRRRGKKRYWGCTSP